MKFKAFGLALASFLAVAGLTGCGVKASNENIDNPKPYVDANLNEVEHHVNGVHESIYYRHVLENLSDYSIIDSSLEVYGVALVRNSTGHIGVYSFTHNKFIVNCSYYYEWLTYEVSKTDIGVFFKFDYENKTQIYDNLGNVLYDGDEIDHWSTYTVISNNNFYLELEADYYTNRYVYVNGALNEVDYMPEPDVFEPEIPDIEEDEEPGYRVGDLFKEGKIIDLSEFGNDGYYLNGSSRGITTLFSNDNIPVQTFLIPTDCKPIITGEFIYYQSTYPLAEDNKNFDYYNNNVKYALTTYKIDMLKGIQSIVPFNYIIDDVIPFKDKEGKYTTQLLQLQKINDYQVLDRPRMKLVDTNLTILQDYTELRPDKFIKVGNNGNYYNLATNILYDAELNVITYLEYMAPEYLASKDVFIGSLKGKTGIVDSDGRVIAPFEYDDIIYDEDYSFALLKKDENIMMFDLDSKSFYKTFYDATLRTIDDTNKTFAIECESNVYLICLDGREELTYMDNYNFMYMKTYNSLNDSLYKALVYNEDGNVVTIVLQYGNDTISCNTNRTTNDFSEKTGRNFEDAIEAKIGTNNIHANPDGGYTYVKVPNFGLYSYICSSSMTLEDVYFDEWDSYYGDVVQHHMDNVLDSSNTYLLDTNTSYVKLNFTGYKEFTIELLSNIDSLRLENSEHAITQSGSYKAMKVDLSSNQAYAFKTTNATTYIYRETDSGFVPFEPSYKYVNDEKIFTVNEDGTYYFIFYVSYYDNATYKLYELNINTIPDYDENKIISVPSNGYAIRKFTCLESGAYKVNSTYSNFQILGYYYDGIKELELTDFGNYKTASLLSHNQYIIVFINNNYGTYSASISFEKLQYSTLDTYTVEQSIRIPYSSKRVYKFNVTEDNYYEATGYNDYAFPLIYSVDENNDTQSIEPTLVNGKLLYRLSRDVNYALYVHNSGSNSVNITLSKSPLLNNVISMNDGSSQSVSGDKFMSFTPTQDGYYRIKETSRYVSRIEVFEFDAATQNTVAIQPEKGHYNLTATKTYLIHFIYEYQYSESYTISATFVTDNIATLPDYVIDANTFDELNGTYTSTNHTNYSTSSMSITFNKSGEISFRVYISSESRYDKCQISINGVVQNTYSGNSYTYDKYYNVEAGDELVITYSKDSSNSYGSDLTKISYISFTPSM